MLYQWIYAQSEHWNALNVFRYITFRTFLSFLTSFAVAWVLGERFIVFIQNLQIKQTVRNDGPQSHLKKTGTPTMGGGLILLSLLASTLLWVNLLNPLVLGCLLITLGFGCVGFWDDYLKVTKKNSKGVSGKVRLLLEFLISGSVIGFLIHSGHMSTIMTMPLFKHIQIDLGWWYIAFGGLVIVGCANAVNLTDGLDGLATVPFVVACSAFLVFCYVAGHFEISSYLQIPFVSGAGELTPLVGAMIAAGLGFLWYNSYPAQIFMGDVGSLSLGGFLGSLAVFTKNEFLLVIIGGVFVIEALSVITQVISFKLTGKRIFKMAPIHHHFELKGIAEPKVIVRFWIVSLLLAVISLSTLKLR